MNVDRSPMWIGLADLLLSFLSAVIVALAPTKTEVEGLKEKAESLITGDDPMYCAWPLSRRRQPLFRLRTR